MPPRRAGTGFIGLNTYLGLNKGSAANMAGGVDSLIQGKADDYLTSMRQAEGEFRDSLNTAMGPTGAPLTAADADARSKGDWKGPSGFTGEQLQPLYAKAQEASAAANATDTNSGLSSLLREKYGANTWGGGMLDAALTGTAGADRFAASRGAFGRLTENLGDISRRATQQAGEARDAFKKQQDTYAGMVPGLQQKESEAAQARQQAERDKLAQAEADAAAGGMGETGANARNIAQDKNTRGRPDNGTNITGRVGTGGGGMSEAEARRLGRGIHRNLGGWF